MQMTKTGDMNQPSATVNLRVGGPKGGPDPSASPFESVPKQVGAYAVVGEKARGGMAVILHVRDQSLDRDLAVKLLPHVPERDPESAVRFQQEARILARLQHPGIVPILSADRLSDGRPYFVMPLIQGANLTDLLARRSSRSAGLGRWLRVFLHICETLAYVHSRAIVHADLKPANIMVGRFGEVLVMDWGLARGLGVEEKPSLSAPPGIDDVETVVDEQPPKATVSWVAGTPAYMSPEQACGDASAIDRQTDVFGLGAILCEILTGEPPYQSSDPKVRRRSAEDGDQRELHSRLAACGADAVLVQLVRDCLAPKRSDRPLDAGIVALRIGDYLSSLENLSHAAELQRVALEIQRQERRKHRGWRIAAWCGATLTMMLAGIGAIRELQRWME